MNIIEAVKTGKRFKRVCKVCWVECIDSIFVFKVSDKYYEYTFSREDFLAKDWEVEE